MTLDDVLVTEDSWVVPDVGSPYYACPTSVIGRDCRKAAGGTQRRLAGSIIKISPDGFSVIRRGRNWRRIGRLAAAKYRHELSNCNFERQRDFGPLSSRIATPFPLYWLNGYRKIFAECYPPLVDTALPRN